MNKHKMPFLKARVATAIVSATIFVTSVSSTSANITILAGLCIERDIDSDGDLAVLCTGFEIVLNPSQLLPFPDGIPGPDPCTSCPWIELIDPPFLNPSPQPNLEDFDLTPDPELRAANWGADISARIQNDLAAQLKVADDPQLPNLLVVLGRTAQGQTAAPIPGPASVGTFDVIAETDFAVGEEQAFIARAFDPDTGEAVLNTGTFEYVEGQSVGFDVKPQSCPNLLNGKSGGVLPVAITGTDDFDVARIDPASVTLVSEDGPAPLRWSMEDVTTPFEPFIGKAESTDEDGSDPCDACTTKGADGIVDLTLSHL